MKDQRRYTHLLKDIPKERIEARKVAQNVGNEGSEEVVTAFTKEQAVIEASRCLSCRKCLGCGLCVSVCQPKAIDLEEGESETEIEADRIIVTPGLKRICSPFEKKYRYNDLINVIDFIQYDRMIKDRKIFESHLLRPSDGEMVKKIALINAADAPDHNVVSNTILDQVLLTIRIFESNDIYLLLNGDKDGCTCNVNKYSNIHLLNDKILGLTEDHRENVIVEFEDAQNIKREIFDLAVLFNWLTLPQYIQDFLKTSGVKHEIYSQYLETDNKESLKTVCNNVFFYGFYFKRER